MRVMYIKCILFLSSFIALPAAPLDKYRELNNREHDKRCYDLIHTFLNQYQRSITLLDIGADRGFYSLQIAEDYNNAVCVMIESNNFLLDTCKRYGEMKTKKDELVNIVLLDTCFTPEILQHLGDCEHFDVILVLSVMRKFGEQWRQNLEAMLGLGDYLIVEVLSDQNDLRDYVMTHGGKNMGNIFVDSNGRDGPILSTLYSITLNNSCLRRKTWMRSVMHQENRYRIESSFLEKNLVKPMQWPHSVFKTVPWIAGINLSTFKMCRGVYPTSEQLKKVLPKDATHSDWIMNNMIVQGNNITLIDGDDSLSKRYFSPELLQANQEIFDLDDPMQVEHHFWHKLVKIPVSKRQTIKFLNQLFPLFSLVFDIDSLVTVDTVFIDRCLGYGAKVMSYNPSLDCIDALQETRKVENIQIVMPTLFNGNRNRGLEIQASEIGITGDCFGPKAVDDRMNLDSLISRYGRPQFCVFHGPAKDSLAYLRTVSEPINAIAYKFDIRDKASWKACLDYVASEGYKQFNFSARDIPAFILESNYYINVQKEWASSAPELVDAIEEFAALDYDGSAFWGYIFAIN